jgi:hypothetical protein
VAGRAAESASISVVTRRFVGRRYSSASELIMRTPASANALRAASSEPCVSIAAGVLDDDRFEAAPPSRRAHSRQRRVEPAPPDRQSAHRAAQQSRQSSRRPAVGLEECRVAVGMRSMRFGGSRPVHAGPRAARRIQRHACPAQWSSHNTCSPYSSRSSSPAPCFHAVEAERDVGLPGASPAGSARTLSKRGRND